MSGVFGIAADHTRVVLAVREADDGRGFTRSVGDGRRHLVPAAARPDGLWGSAAAERWLAALPTDTAPADHLDGWRVDPHGPAFLRGVGDRLTTYLGRTTPSSSRGWELCMAARPSDHRLLRSRAREAGLGTVATLAPTDALVCRWCTEPGAAVPASGRVVAVACGQRSTEVAEYRVEAVPGEPRFARRESAWLEVGTGAAEAELAQRVLQRCREGVSPRSSLALLDGTLEFAAALRDVADGEEVAWHGALATHLFSPIRLTRAAVEQWPELAVTATAVAVEVDRQIAARPSEGTPLLLLGGIGAEWPSVEAALRRRAPVWRSRTSSHDIATGATYWPALRGLFETSARPARPVPEVRTTPATGTTRSPAVDPVPGERDDEQAASRRVDVIDVDSVPPWERHLLEP